jgi:N4-gp56 family major capsid protein
MFHTSRINEFGEYQSPNVAFLGGINVANQFSGDYVPYLDKKILPIALKELVVYQFAEKKTLPKGQGNTWLATRYQRLPLPFAPLSEAVPPAGETLTISQVQCVAQQWGDTVTVSDVAKITIMHDPFQQAIRLIAIQQKETYERNVFNMLMGIAQVNYVNSRGSRAALVAGDVIDTTTVLRTYGALATLGALKFGGPTEPNPQKSARGNSGGTTSPHFCAVCHTLAVADWSQNQTVILARAYSQVTRLYNYEIGEWGGIRFTESNMVPFWTGFALVTGTPSTTGGTLAASTTYNIIVTGQDTQNQFESYVAQVSGNLTTTGTTGSISVTLPSTAGYTYSVYIGTSATPTNLGVCASGPTVGPLAGMATQLAAGATVVITGVGVTQVPPAAPATGVTVYRTFVFGQQAFAVVTLENVEHFMLTKADKSDPLNQKAVVGWKGYNGGLILNQLFLAAIEHVSAYSATFG